MVSADIDLIGTADGTVSVPLDAINYQFSIMLGDQINSSWVIMWTKTSTETTVKQAGVDTDEATLSKEITEWAKLQNEYASTKKAWEDLIEAGADYDTVAAAQNSYMKAQYDLIKAYPSPQPQGAWKATIGSITVVSVGSPTSVLLKVTFASGTLYYRNEEEFVDEIDLANLVYAFRTDLTIESVTLDDSSVTTDAKAAVESKLDVKKLEQTYLDNADFTIEAILMDLQNADIATYDVGTSSEFENPQVADAVKTMFQFGMTNDERRKYVLGYSVPRPDLAAIPTAIFAPTGASRSISYMTDTSLSARDTLNFHLFMHNNQVVKNRYLPQSMLEGYTDKEIASIDGILALRYSQFSDKVIKPTVEAALADILDKYGGVKITQVDELNWMATGYIHEGEVDADLGEYGRSYNIITTDDMTAEAAVTFVDGRIVITFTVNVRYVQTLFALRTVNSTEQPTKVAVVVYDSTASPGIYRARMKCGTNGKLAAESSEMVSDFEMEENKSESQVFYSGGITTQEATALDNKLRNRNAEIGRMNESVDAKLVDATDLSEEMDELSVVLPLGNVYLFQNIGFKSNSVSSVLTFEMTYSPLVNNN